MGQYFTYCHRGKNRFVQFPNFFVCMIILRKVRKGVKQMRKKDMWLKLQKPRVLERSF